MTTASVKDAVSEAQDFTITRTFDAPRSLVWKAWTQGERLARWWGPKGGKTTLSLRGGPINATDEERKIFAGMFDSMRQGFGGTFDQLADYLAKS